MCARLALALLLVVSCSSCISGRDRVFIVGPVGPVRPGGDPVATEAPPLVPTPTPPVPLKPQDRREECIYEVTGATLSIAALAAHSNDTCFAFTNGCSVTAAGTLLKLNAGCDCDLTVSVRKSGMCGRTAVTATLSAGYSQDFAISPFTDSFTVGP